MFKQTFGLPFVDYGLTEQRRRHYFGSPVTLHSSRRSTAPALCLAQLQCKDSP
jgi:hypothetical protein